jgi:ABC-type multidrug transport system fused ATPase/permease subunit
MNEDKNTIVKMTDSIFGTLAGVLVSFFDGLRQAVDHANPSLFGLVATLLPFALPLPVAFMTAHSAQAFFGWEPWAANVLGFSLEGLGLLVWVMLVDSIVARMNNDNEKINDFVNFLWGVAITYEALLIFINVILSWNDGASLIYGLTLLLICLLPALSASMYGLHKRAVNAQLARERTEATNQKEKERQERREDRQKERELKLKYAADSEAAKLKKSFRK